MIGISGVRIKVYYLILKAESALLLASYSLLSSLKKLDWFCSCLLTLFDLKRVWFILGVIRPLILLNYTSLILEEVLI